MLALVLGAAVLAVGWAAVLVRLADVPPVSAAAWRLSLAGVFLGLLARGAPGLPAPATSTGPAAARLPRFRVHAFTLGAGVLLAWHFGAWFHSLALTSISSSVTLVTTTPLFAAVLAPWLLGEPTGRRAWIGLALAFVGSLWLSGADFGSGDGGRGALIGDLLAVSAAVASSLYFMAGRALRDVLPLPVYFARVTACAAVLLVAVGLATGAPLWGFPPVSWLALLGLAVVPHVLGHGLLHHASRHLPAQRVQIVLLGEPLASIGYAWLLWGERPAAHYWPAAALILGGVALSSADGRQRPARRASQAALSSPPSRSTHADM